MSVLLSSQMQLCWVSQSHYFFTSIQYLLPQRRYCMNPLLTLSFTLSDEREEVQMVCAGKEFRLPVYSTSRIVTFNPDSGLTRRVLLNRTTVSKNMWLWSLLHSYDVCVFFGFFFLKSFQAQISNVNLKLQVKEPRFEWTRDKMLILREVTHADQGLYAIKLSSGFTYETVHLTVSGKSSILLFSL